MKNICITILLSVLFMGTSCAESQPRNGGDDYLLELAQKRRSIRRYTDRKIERSLIDSILQVAMFAPSSYGQRPVEFVVVDDKKTLAALADTKRIGAPSVRTATVAIVVIADREKGELWIEDTSVAASYILLAAEHYGIGACWNQIRDRDGQHASSEQEIRELLGIPSRYSVLCIIAMGYKGEQKAPHSTNELDFGKIHFGRF